MSFLNAESAQPGQTVLITQSTCSKPSWMPHCYQETGIKLLLGQGAAALFLDPGLGKTTICLAAFKILKKLGYAKKMLVVAPLRPCYKVWPDEIKKWAEFSGLTFTVLHGKDKEKNLASDVDIYVINPEGLAWLFAPTTKRPNFDVLCLDESSKFKNSTTQRFKLLKPLLASFARRWILTGTPVPNGLTDLFGQIYILDLGASLGRFITHYRREFFDQSGYGGYDYSPKPDAFARIVERIKPLVLQLSAADHLKMPELVVQKITVDLESSVMKIYRQVEDAFYVEMESGSKIVAANAAVAGGKCRQIANGAVYHSEGADGRRTMAYVEIHDEKLDALEDLVDQLGGKPILVLYEFQHDRERILKRFPTAEVIGSGISMKKTDDIIDRFNAGKITMLLGHPDSMGHGLNMQGSCHHVCWFGITWNLDFHDQAYKRVYRQGQKAETVFMYYLVAAATLDEKVLKVLTAKDRTQQTLLSALGED